MQNLKKILLILFCFSSQLIFSQNVSIATDLSVLRNFRKGQRFWSYGQNILIDFHVTSKNAAYVSACYYAEGNFKNQITAIAKSSSTSPQQISFINRSRVRLREFAIGWKHYLKGSSESDVKWNLYHFAGFGLIFGKAINTYSASIDTTLYESRPVNGTGYFKRLSVDLGLGGEIHLGGEIFLYTEGRVWIPTSDYPSKYLYVNREAPLVATISSGLRILF